MKKKILLISITVIALLALLILGVQWGSQMHETGGGGTSGYMGEHSQYYHNGKSGVSSTGTPYYVDMIKVEVEAEVTKGELTLTLYDENNDILWNRKVSSGELLRETLYFYDIGHEYSYKEEIAPESLCSYDIHIEEQTYNYRYIRYYLTSFLVFALIVFIINKVFFGRNSYSYGEDSFYI